MLMTAPLFCFLFYCCICKLRFDVDKYTEITQESNTIYNRCLVLSTFIDISVLLQHTFLLAFLILILYKCYNFISIKISYILNELLNYKIFVLN